MARWRRWGGYGGAAFSPLSLTWSLYLRADMGITLIGSEVDAWADQSGNGNHHVAPVAANRLIYTAADATLNNQPTVSGDALQRTLRRAVMALGGNLPAFTYWIVGRHNAVGNNAVLANYEPAFSIRCRSTSAGIFNGFMTGFSTNSVSVWRPNNRALIYAWDGANQRVYVNNVLEGGPTVNATAAQANGAAHSLMATTAGLGPINGTIAEIGLARSALSAAQMLSLYNYATARYGALT